MQDANTSEKMAAVKWQLSNGSCHPDGRHSASSPTFSAGDGKFAHSIFAFASIPAK